VKGYSKEQAISEAARCVDCELCVDACPANMDIPRYIESVFNNDTANGVDWIYKTNPLPGVCGRVCTHKCETVCSIGHRGEAVAIRWLKRYIMDQESEEDIIRHARENIVKKGTGKIAIVGAGPSGLAAAYYLSLMGYDVTIFEAKNLPGGVMRYGIPRYRLPDEALDKDINVIKALGVKIKCNTSVGKDITLNELKEKHDAVFIGTGFTLGRSSEIQGSDHKDVLLALPLLEKIRNYLRNPEESRKPPVPDSLLVIGGGNVAMDVARSIVRLQRLEGKEANVKITSLESMEELPADLEEIVEGREEGIQFFPSRGPKEVVIENGKVKGLKTVACTRVFDEKGQFNPIFDESNVMLIDGEMIVEAIGQAPDYAYLPDELKNKLEFIKGRLIVNEKGQTSIEWLFAGGDIVSGPDIIHGVADGHKAAVGIDEFLNREEE
jgi:glutamate synthase (NADPH/NADH) small chain